MKKFFFMGILCLSLCLLGVFSPRAVQGYTLPNAPDYAWWYGSAPTSAGMMMGYYDINGYGGLLYDNLVPGGTAELSNYGNPGALANNIIASPGHKNDFYKSGYGGSGDDTYAGRSFDSLADFMGTSQDSIGNANGTTMFYYYMNGQKIYAADLIGAGFGDYDGMVGMLEYLQYAGYGASEIYTQLTDNMGNTYGFTFADYMAEINAGRVVMIQVGQHSMLGYGYDEDENLIYLHDTWESGQHSMPWGGEYSGLEQWAVVCFTPTGGETPSVPEPATMLLLGSGLIGLAGLRRKFRK